jgi:hypothetical protein
MPINVSPNDSKMEKPIGKGESTRKGEGNGEWKGLELTLCLIIEILWSMSNPMPGMTSLHSCMAFP